MYSSMKTCSRHFLLYHIALLLSRETSEKRKNRNKYLYIVANYLCNPNTLTFNEKGPKQKLFVRRSAKHNCVEKEKLSMVAIGCF